MRTEESQKQAKEKCRPLILGGAVKAHIGIAHHIGIHVGIRVVDNHLRRGRRSGLRLLERRHLLAAARTYNTVRINRSTTVLAEFRLILAFSAACAERGSILKHDAAMFTIHVHTFLYLKWDIGGHEFKGIFRLFFCYIRPVLGKSHMILNQTNNICRKLIIEHIQYALQLHHKGLKLAGGEKIFQTNHNSK